MDVTPYLDLAPAPCVVFGQLAERGETPRFMVRQGADAWRPVSWDEFAAAIRRAARYLIDSGLQPGERAAVLGTNSVEWVVAALAIQAAGGVMVPIYPSCTPEQVAYVVAHSDAQVVFASGSLRAQVPWGVPVVVLDGDDGEPESSSASWGQALARGRELDAADPGVFDTALDAVGLDDVALMLYTSGTTGNPKGVPLTHRNVGVNGRDWLACNGPGVDTGATDILWLPLSHIFGFGEACLGNTLGWTTWLADPVSVLGLLSEVRPTVFMSVPRYWEKLAEQAASADGIAAQRERLRTLTGGRLSFCLSGGAGLKVEVKERFLDAGMLIIEGYGLTEASPTLTLNRPDDFRFDTVGRPLPSVELRLADDGEIQARGDSIFRGYHKDAEATAEAFTPDGWLRTGDLGAWTDDGFLRIVGRKKEILVTAGGKNVPPANIELRFADEPLIAHVVVYGDGKPCLVAGVWLDPLGVRQRYPDAADPGRDAAIRDAISDRVMHENESLARHERIRAWTIVEEPLTVEAGWLTPTLKVRRNRVYAHFGDVFEALYDRTGGGAP